MGTACCFWTAGAWKGLYVTAVAEFNMHGGKKHFQRGFHVRKKKETLFFHFLPDPFLRAVTLVHASNITHHFKLTNCCQNWILQVIKMSSPECCSLFSLVGLWMLTTRREQKQGHGNKYLRKLQFGYCKISIDKCVIQVVVQSIVSICYPTSHRLFPHTAIVTVIQD